MTVAYGWPVDIAFGDLHIQDFGLERKALCGHEFAYVFNLIKRTKERWTSLILLAMIAWSSERYVLLPVQEAGWQCFLIDKQNDELYVVGSLENVALVLWAVDNDVPYMDADTIIIHKYESPEDVTRFARSFVNRRRQVREFTDIGEPPIVIDNAIIWTHLWLIYETMTNSTLEIELVSTSGSTSA